MLIGPDLLFRSTILSSFTDFVELIRLEVSIYHNARVCGQWQLNSHSEGVTCFHMVTQGDCLLTVPGQGEGKGEWALMEGDLVIFPSEVEHTMVPITKLEGPQEHLLIADSQDRSGTSMLCGEVKFAHQGSEALLNALPTVFIIERNESSLWLNHLYQLIVAESLSIRESSSPILNRLCELLMAYALRHFVENEDCGSGMLALFAHKNISKALDAIHKNPAQAWGLVSLAECAGMSRTQFANSFKSLSTWTPMQYLSWWRMQLAWDYLRAGKSVALVAETVGYQSEAAFSRVFRKHFDQSAGAVRRSS
ncbi:MAG: AraC-like DNA-binding protein [Oceanicoccus sp.]|jgi:AraC-like DNA-binding protein